VVRLCLVLLAWAVSTLPAQADPVSIGAAITGFATWYASIGAAGQLLVQIGIGIALTAASYGLQYLISGGARRSEQARAADAPAGVTLPEFGGIIDARRIYGTQVVSGGVFFHKTVADSGASAPNRWVFGLLLSEGECDGLVSLIINGVECELDEDLIPQTYPWQDNGTAYLSVSFRSGADDQTQDTIIASRFPSPPADFYPGDADRTTKWTNFRQRGVCTVVLDLHFGTSAAHHQQLWGTAGVPNIQLRVRGLKVYDRSNPLHDPDDSSTWEYSEIATICIEDFLCAEMGGQATHAEIDDTAAKESIAIDKESVATLDGSEERGTVNGVALSTEADVDVLAAMAQQNRATITKAGGKYVIRADRPADPVATIHQGQWMGQLNYRNERETRSVVEGVVLQFFPHARFNESAEIGYPDSALDDPDAQRVTLPFCDSPATAQRLGFGMVKDNEAGRSISGMFDISVLVAPGKANNTLEIGDVIRFEVDDPYEEMAGNYRVDGIEINANFTVSLALTEASADAITGWSTSLESEFEDLAAG
jgi:hypothetical protein